MEINCALVIIWFALQETYGNDIAEKHFNAINHERKTSNDSFMLQSLLNEENINDTALPLSTNRIKREPPFTIIKHKTILIEEAPKLRSRLRISRPAYGPPNYKGGEPINIYKPQIETFESSRLSLHPSFSLEKAKQINFRSPHKSNTFFEKPIKFDLQDTSFNERPEYVIVESGGDKLKSNFVYITDNQNKGKLGYVLPGGNTGKGGTEYVFYEDNEKPPSISSSYSSNSKGHPVYGPLIPTKIEAFTPKPHKIYGIPKASAPMFSLKTPYHNDDDKSGSKNVHLIYAPEYEINPIRPATDFQVPKGFPKSFKSGYIGPSYLPPPDFHSSPKMPDFKNNSSTIHHSESPIYVISKEIFDNSKLPLEDTKKHPNFDYQKTSYEVPIYEAIPFDSTTTSQEVFPPNLSDIFNEESFSTIAKGSRKIEVTLPKKFSKDDFKEENDTKEPNSSSNANQFSTFVSNLHSLSASLDGISEAPAALVDELTTSTTRRPRKKRRRTKVPNIKRHAIDINTLKKVLMESDFHSETTTGVAQYEEVTPQNDITTTTLEKKPNFVLLSSTNKPTNFYELPSWESTKINKDIRSGEKVKATEVQVISIQKSKSQSYYDGTMAPETVKQLGINSRKDNTKLKQTQLRNIAKKNS